MQGPGMVTLGQRVMAIGGVLLATGMLSVLYIEQEQAEKWVSAGLLTLVAGTGIVVGPVGWLCCVVYYVAKFPFAEQNPTFGVECAT